MVASAAGSMSIMISVSLSARLSPRAREPNRAACATPRARKARSFSRSRSRISCLFMTNFIPQIGRVGTGKTVFLFAPMICTIQTLEFQGRCLWCIILDFCPLCVRIPYAHSAYRLPSHPFDNANVALGSSSEQSQRFLIGRAVMRSPSLLHTVELDNHGALLETRLV